MEFERDLLGEVFELSDSLDLLPFELDLDLHEVFDEFLGSLLDPEPLGELFGLDSEPLGEPFGLDPELLGESFGLEEGLLGEPFGLDAEPLGELLDSDTDLDGVLSARVEAEDVESLVGFFELCRSLSSPRYL